ncbi:MAG: hypothetical protein P1V20_08875 [Verrucomicrobiales bacterium]|nr:hypothetical protein [Verrucomicrobiales bacterium]
MKSQTTFPDTTTILESFTDEIRELNGTVSYNYITREAMFLRANLPDCREVAKNDRIQHGIAVRTTNTSIIVHPYTFREICTNGAIHIENISSKEVELGSSDVETAGVDYFFREAVRSCATAEAFEANLAEMTAAMDEKIHLAIVMSAMAGHGVNSRVIDRIIARFIGTKDRSGYGLFNAITSTARDEKNPEEKWRLESVGGGILAWLKKPDQEIASGYTAQIPVEKPAEKEHRFAVAE